MRRAAFVALAASALLVLLARAIATIRDADISDFRCFYEAGRVVSNGLDPFDRGVWAAATMTDPSRLPPCDPTFVYPMWTAIAMVPFASLPLVASIVLWEILTLVSIVASVELISRAWSAPSMRRPLLLLALSSRPAFSVVANAQFGALLLLASAAMAVLLGRSRAAAALSWAILLAKPHVVAFTLVLPGVADRRFARAAATVMLAIVAASLLVSPRWPQEVANELVAQRRLVDPGLDTFWGLAAALGLGSAFAVGAVLASLALIAVLLPRRRLLPAELVAVAAPASLLLTPYARPHDEVVLVLSWAAVLWSAHLGPPPRTRLLIGATIGAALVLPWSIFALSLRGIPSSLGVFVPLVTAILVTTSLSRRRAGRDVEAARLGRG
jgi:hypothetical protein